MSKKNTLKRIMDVSCEMLLHPELLNNDQLILIIQQRHLKIHNLREMTRSDLLELFHHYCVPYGQRKYRDSGRGKVLNKARRLSEESPTKLNTSFLNEGARKSYFHSCERLKPPPDLLSGHMKRIKIENNAKQVLSKDIISANKRKMSTEEAMIHSPPPQKKERQLITWP